jgi:7-keto-8-aminopelargonate synthetase-like enzyme
MAALFPTNSLPGRTVQLADTGDYLWFSGTDYLGMGHNEPYLSHLRKGLEIYGSHFGSSRNNTLQLPIYEAAEAALATFTGSPDALVVSSGMWAGQLLIKYLEGKPHQFHYAPGVHPALWGSGYAPTADSWTDWFRATTQRMKKNPPGQSHVLCTDSIGSPWVEAFDLSLLHQLPDHCPVWLVVDDSHGLGVLGVGGKGVFSQLPADKPNLRVVVTSSLNKALGVPGGVIFGDTDLMKDIRSTAWFSGSSPSAPAYLYALHQNLLSGVYPEAHRTLIENTEYFTSVLSSLQSFSHVDRYPAFCSHDAALYDHLLQNLILTACFPYPKPTDQPVMRLVVSALHQKKDLDRLAEVLAKYNGVKPFELSSL